ncbi:hypothetical protein KL925_001543 [Ogataea polymorpha]|nr:hypothetical protein KL925_001543 [Ogataea polymorpha]
MQEDVCHGPFQVAQPEHENDDGDECACKIDECWRRKNHGVYVRKRVLDRRCCGIADRGQYHEDHADRAGEGTVEVSAPDLFVEQNRRNKGGIRNDGHDAERRHDADGGQTVADKITHLS